MHTTADFWDRIAPRYSKRAVGNIPAYEHTLARTRSYLAAGDTVLETGCGTGSTALTLSDAVAQYTASDFANEMLAIGQTKARAAGVENLTFTQADVDLAPFADASQDAVLSFNLLHLVPDLSEALAHANRVLKPGGLLISKTACLGRGNLLMRGAVKVLQWIGKAPFVAFFSADELEAAMRAAGFEIVESDDHNRRPVARFVVARKL